MENMQEGKVIQFRPLDRPRFIEKKMDSPSCKHRAGIIVDEQSRTIECEVCGVVLDPFGHFLELAKEEAILCSHIQHFKQRKALLMQEVEKLEKTIKGLRATYKKLFKSRD